jgi:cytochrome c peroxidase
MTARHSVRRSTVLPTALLLATVAFLASCADSGTLLVPEDDPAMSRGPGGGGGGGGTRGGGGGGTPPPPPSAGEVLFTQETFGGNGRTCATCHVPPSFKINPQQIQLRDPDDVLFVGKFDIPEGFAQHGRFAAPLVTAGGDTIVVQRGITTVFNLASTAPYMMDGRAATLAQQINDAVLLHAHDLDLTDSPTKRMPTQQEIDDIIEFMFTRVPDAPINAPDPERVARGEEIFFGKGQCSTCHIPPLFTDNLSHDLGTPNHSMAPNLPFDPGVCRIDPTANDCAVSGRSIMTRHLVGVRAARPYFHNNMASTLFPLMDFYTSNAFRNSPAFQRLGLEPFTLDTEERLDLHAFLFTL